MRKVVLVAIMAVMAVACSLKPEGAIVVDTPRGGWSLGEEVTLDYENLDSLSLYRLGVALRVESGKVEGPVTLRVGCVSPSGAYFESPVTLQAEEVHSGGSFTEIESPWVEGARFTEGGDYLFILTPEQELEGVWMAGVTIVKE